MTNLDFIAQHRTDDVRKLALKKVPEGVDIAFCLPQIEGWQLARKKIPEWAATEGLLFPPRLSMEQCSSQQTALYKRRVVERLLDGQYDKMMDLTGGFGIDFSYMAPLFRKAIYVEQQEHLCQIARHNFGLLRLQQAEVRNAQSQDVLTAADHTSLIYADPARRDGAGRKVVLLQDCQPDVVTLQEELMAHAGVVMLKLSPMLDIQQALRQLHQVREVHVVSVDGECKEVLLVLYREKRVATVHCVNLSAQEHTFSTTIQNAEPVIATHLERYLYEPNASILKAGVQNSLCQKYNVRKLHSFSHLFISSHFIEDFPGRSFEIEDAGSFAKKDLKRILADITQCNLTVRNFPATVAALRKRLKLREGGDIYLFATTLADGSHALIRCKRL